MHLMIYQILKPDFEFQDQRGSLVQLIHEGYKQINILTTRKGVVRGGHYHKRCKEAFYIISGSVDITLFKDKDKKQLHFTAGDFFEIMPYTIHCMSFPKDCIMVALYDDAIEGKTGGKDIFAP